MNATIYALASGAGRSGVAVVRISGTACDRALEALGVAPLPSARKAVRTTFRDPDSGEPLDDGLTIRFPAPRSYTGEDVAELHIHGGLGVISAVLDALGRVHGLRMAEPGEFTRRAVLAGKMDLTAAEGLIDLIDADTDAQRRQALRQSGGELRRLYDGWRERLIALLAHIEAVIDFPDEDLPQGTVEKFEADLGKLTAEMFSHLDDGHRGERLRRGVMVAIVGPPNAGKSSLLNRLARRDAAIVSARAGTTRDVVEVWLDLAGLPVLVADTAGLRDSVDEIEAEGVRRARHWAGAADLRIAVFAANAGTPTAAASDLIDESTLVVVNKIDRGDPDWVPETESAGVFYLSLTEDRGVEQFVAALSDAVRARMAGGMADAPMITRARHREAVSACQAGLMRAGKAPLPELAAEDIRLGIRSLAGVTGAVDVEDVLDVIFRDFCIGK